LGLGMLNFLPAQKVLKRVSLRAARQSGACMQLRTRSGRPVSCPDLGTVARSDRHSLASACGPVCRSWSGGAGRTERRHSGPGGVGTSPSARAFPVSSGDARQCAHGFTRDATVLPADSGSGGDSAYRGRATRTLGARVSSGAQGGADDCGSGRCGRDRTRTCEGGDPVSGAGSDARTGPSRLSRQSIYTKRACSAAQGDM